MCIICNCGDTGDEFLIAFEGVKHEMKRAKDLILKCSQVAVDAESRRQYDATHKAITRMIHDWNRLEEFRENVKVKGGALLRRPS